MFGFSVMFVCGIFYAQGMEWFLHRYVLHGIGKKRGHPLSFHFRQHHRAARIHHFRDEVYEHSPFAWNASGKELMSLFGLGLLHLPILLISSGFVLGSGVGMVRYYTMHKKSHLDPEWCKSRLPWHYDHHMAPNQDANWGVTTDWVDRLMGTREIYLGTAREEKDSRRRFQHQLGLSSK